MAIDYQAHLTSKFVYSILVARPLQVASTHLRDALCSTTPSTFNLRTSFAVLHLAPSTSRSAKVLRGLDLHMFDTSYAIDMWQTFDSSRSLQNFSTEKQAQNELNSNYLLLWQGKELLFVCVVAESDGFPVNLPGLVDNCTWAPRQRNARWMVETASD